MRRRLPSAVAHAIGVFALALSIAAAPDAGAQTAPAASAAAAVETTAGPTNAQRVRPQPANSALHDPAAQAGRTTLPGAESGTLIQHAVRYPGSSLTNAGEAWRQARNRWIIPLGGALLLLVSVAIAVFYRRVGPLGADMPGGAQGGRKIERFTLFERAVHMLNMFAFVLLALTGVVMAYGKFLLLPLLGSTLFGWLALASRTVHNFAGPLFALTLLVVLLTFVRSNLPRRGDWPWLKKFGAMVIAAGSAASRQASRAGQGSQTAARRFAELERETPSHRFNAGEKVVFWGGAFLLGLIVVGSGLLIDQLMPGFAYTRAQMQVGLMIHGIASALMIVMFMGHAYIGTIGMKGAWKTLREGYVNEAWAREHHALWYADIMAGKIPAQRSVVAPADALESGPAVFRPLQ